MAKRNGSIIGPANVPSGAFGSAGGVWRLKDAFNYIKNGTWPVALGYQVNNSLRFNSGSNDNLTRTPASASNRRTFTISFWHKKSVLSTRQEIFSQYAALNNNEWIELAFNSDDTLFLSWYSSGVFATNQLFRDVGAWYHVVVAVDTTQATDTNRIKLYVNGSQVTSFSSITYPAQNYDTGYNQASSYHIGDLSLNGNFDLNGYLAEYYSIDGQALTPSSFGQTDSTTGIWTPIAYTGSYGTNGFYLKFANSASLGTDSSGNGNNFTVNNLTSVDQSTDTPTNNFCTANPLNNGMGGTFTEGNLVVANASATDKAFGATIGMTSGKWYWEVKPTTLGDRNAIGILDINYNTFSATVNSNYAFLSLGNSSYTTSGSITGSIPSFSANDIICFAFDADNGKLYFSKNANLSTSTATYFTITASTYTVGVREAGGTPGTNSFNFGSPQYSANGYTDASGLGNFSYAPPSGYYALCTKNLNLVG